MKLEPPVTKNIVGHDFEKGGGVGPVQGLELDPGPGRLMDIKTQITCV